MKRLVYLLLGLFCAPIRKCHDGGRTGNGNRRSSFGQALQKMAPKQRQTLFIDWALSEEGQSMITTFGRVVARKGVKQRFPELVEKEPFLVDVDFIGPILDQSGKEFSQIFLGR